MVKITSLPLNTESLFTYLDPRTESKLYLFECEEDLIRALEPFNIETFSFNLVSEISKKFNDDENAPIILQVDYDPLKSSDKMGVVRRACAKKNYATDKDTYKGIDIAGVYERIKKLAGCSGHGNSHKGPTITDLFLDAGIDYNSNYFVAKINKGSSVLPKDIVKAFADYFHVSEEYILRGDKPIAPVLKTVHIDQSGGVMKIETE